ncbi:transposase [Spirochaetales bacterium NM-380-WT-3C1]|uniref:Transposase n=1 Tax=Bullifex porci TaxID=2606638 RepID=A0A7X2TQL8_9SPIO|nr:transposase [Bullifex porci]
MQVISTSYGFQIFLIKIAHGTYKISSGKVEGTNNLIKTVRRKAYGYRDNDYFFLKIMDESRREYVRNPKSHKKCD